MNTSVILLLLCAISATATPWYYIKKEIFEHFSENLEQNEPESDSDIVRLPENLALVSYDVRLVPDLKYFTFTGKVGITFKVNPVTKVIVMNSKNLDITEIKLYKGPKQIEVTHEINKKDELLTITAATELEINTNFILTIKFAGKINEYSTGLFKSWYIEDGKKKWLAATNLKATHAREVFPCFDEPKFRAPMTIYISHYEQQLALSNMQVDSSTAPDPDYDNRIWDKFEKTPPIPTHLVAIIVSEFSQITQENKKINVAVRSKATSNTNYALQQAKKLLQNMESFTSVPYSMPKFDIVAVPDLKSGLAQSWGLTSYKEGYVIVNEDLSSDLQKRISTQIIARGLAHQWFGGLITPAWWDYNWLDEGFATYFEYFNTHEVEPLWKIDETFVVEVVQQSLNFESSFPRAMTLAVTKPSQIPDKPNSIDSLKAASILRMMEHIVTQKNFEDALKSYLIEGEKTHNGIVMSANLYESFEDTLLSNPIPLPEKTTITSIFKPWTENIGYPLITVVRDIITHKVKILQSTYKSTQIEKPYPNQEWVVPITYTTKSEQKFSDTRPAAWSLSKEPLELPITISPSDWILVNLQQTAYCRVNYDPANWELLIDELYKNHKIIHVVNRAQLIDDSFSMAADKIIPYTIPMKMAKYLAKEEEILPWEAALSHLEIMRSKFKNTKHAKIMEPHTRDIMQKALVNLGYEIKPIDSFPMKSGKPIIWQYAAEIGDERVIEKALEKYKTYAKDLMKIEPNLRQLVFCTALRYAENPEEVYNNLWSTYSATDNSYDKNLILSILACTGNKDLLEKTLVKLFMPGDDIGKLNENTIIKTTLDSTNGVEVSLKILNDKISQIDEAPENVKSVLYRLLLNVGKHIANKDQLKQMEELKIKCSTLDQVKYAKLTANIENTITNANKYIVTLDEEGTTLNAVFEAIGHKPAEDDRSKTKPTKEDESKPTKPSSSSAFEPSLWIYLLAVGCLVYCNLSF